MKMMLVFVFLCALSSEFVSAQKRVPHFKDYPVAKIYKGKNARLKISRLSRLERLAYGEELLRTVKEEKVDFAGHYIVADWSCGMYCNHSLIIDAETGKIYGWNGSLSVCFPDYDNGFDCRADFSNVEYKIDSKLIIFYGRRNDKNGDNGFHYYKFENGRLRHLKTILAKDQRRALDVSLDKKTNEKNNF